MEMGEEPLVHWVGGGRKLLQEPKEMDAKTGQPAEVTQTAEDISAEAAKKQYKNDEEAKTKPDPLNPDAQATEARAKDPTTTKENPAIQEDKPKAGQTSAEKATEKAEAEAEAEKPEEQEAPVKSAEEKVEEAKKAEKIPEAQRSPEEQAKVVKLKDPESVALSAEKNGKNPPAPALEPTKANKVTDQEAEAAAEEDPGPVKMPKMDLPKMSKAQAKEDNSLEPAEGDAVDVLKQKADAKIAQIQKLEKVKTRLEKKILNMKPGEKWEDEAEVSAETAAVAAKVAADEAKVAPAEAKLEASLVEAEAQKGAKEAEAAPTKGELAMDPLKAVPSGKQMTAEEAEKVVGKAEAGVEAKDQKPADQKTAGEKKEEFKELLTADMPTPKLSN